MPVPTTTLRLRPALRVEIARLARRHRRSFSEVAQDLLDEALRLRTCPGIYFADEPNGREAKLAGTGLGVWEVIRDYLELGQNHAALRKGARYLFTGRGNSRTAEQFLKANGMTDSDRGLRVARTAGSCKPSDYPQVDARDPRRTTQRAVGSPALMAPYVPRRGRRRSEAIPSQNHEVRR